MSRKRRVMVKARIDEISAVDKPAQEPAMVVLFKAAKKPEPDPEEEGEDPAEEAQESPEEEQAEEDEEPDEKKPVKKDGDGPSVGDVGDSSEIATKVPGKRTKKPRDLSVYGKREFSSQERSKLADSGAAMPDGSFPIKNASDLHNAMRALGRAKNPDAAKAHIKSRAKALGLSDQLSDNYRKHSDGSNAADNLNKDDTMTEQLTALQKRLDRAERLAEFNDAEKAFLKSLDGESAEQFLGLEAGQRGEVLAKAADSNPVIYTNEQGEKFQKNDDPRLVAMAKRLDAESKGRREAEKLAKAERLSKRASSELKNLPGEDSDKIALLDLVESLPVEKRTKIEQMLKSHDANLSKSMETKGVGGEAPAAGNPIEELTALAKSIQAKDSKLTEAQAFNKALSTPEGKVLYAKSTGR